MSGIELDELSNTQYAAELARLSGYDEASILQVLELEVAQQHPEADEALNFFLNYAHIQMIREAMDEGWLTKGLLYKFVEAAVELSQKNYEDAFIHSMTFWVEYYKANSRGDAKEAQETLSFFFGGIEDVDYVCDALEKYNEIVASL